jgi:ssDNA-binding Zn-finger/Zn-ribbon topoisomerase 1
MAIACADCGAPMELRNSRFGKFYGCSTYPECKGTHGAHPDGKPLGVPANRETKDARIRAHAAFDRLWKGGPMSRREAYRWMRKKMDMSASEAHIGKFTKEQCDQLTQHAEWERKVPTK